MGAQHGVDGAVGETPALDVGHGMGQARRVARLVGEAGRGQFGIVPCHLLDDPHEAHLVAVPGQERPVGGPEPGRQEPVGRGRRHRPDLGLHRRPHGALVHGGELPEDLLLGREVMVEGAVGDSACSAMSEMRASVKPCSSNTVLAAPRSLAR
ncbi:MAG TPA: hypothetical protein VMB72_09575, partial [Acidimicrobiales bacterium]|nr:hypothetical protein [Acidimicrobiales bacterium]